MSGLKLKKKFKKEWLAALRSGEYAQGKNVLHKRVGGIDEFCCIGVACKLLADADQSIEVSVSQNDIVEDFVYGTSKFYMSRKLQEKIFTRESMRKIKKENICVSGVWGVSGHGAGINLPILNDSRKLSFVELANIIEEQF